MLKRKREADQQQQQQQQQQQASQQSQPKLTKQQKKEEERDSSRYLNKQRTLVLSSRGITYRDRHLLNDICDLLPQSKKDVKFDGKDELSMINELCEIKNCNNCIYFEARKHKDLYMWLSKAPNGPSVKFLVQNIHTMGEVKLTGNCLKGSRPFLCFDPSFDAQPHQQLMKELFIHAFNVPKGHPKSKPFIDHIMSFFYVDNRIWIRNYQIIYDAIDEAEKNKGNKGSKKESPLLVEIGPRLVLNPIRIFNGSMFGSTLWENCSFVSPNKVRSQLLRAKQGKYDARVKQEEITAKRKKESRRPDDQVETVFLQDADEDAIDEQ